MPADLPNHEGLTSFGTWAIWGAVAAIGASLASLRRRVTMGMAALHVALASFIGSAFPYFVFTFWPGLPWFVGIPIAMLIGLLIFSLAIFLDKTSSRVEDIDPTILLPEKLRPRSSPPGG